MNLRDIYSASRKIEHMSMNELRAILWQRGTFFPDNATRKELEQLVKKSNKAG